MKITKTKSKNQVHMFLDPAKMKFRPNLTQQKKVGSPKKTGLSFGFGSRSSGISQLEGEQKPAQLQFVEKITSDSFLIGNSTQLDLIVFSNVKDIAVTELVWEFAPNHSIDKIAVDQKSIRYFYDLRMCFGSRMWTHPLHLPIRR